MASVWKRLQRVNKRAAKFQYTASYHRVDLETTPKWKPNKLSIVWTRRSRRVFTDPQEWEPSLKDPLKGAVIYTMPVNHTVAVTLFKDSRTNELEDKDWTFVLEDVSPSGKRRRVASCAVNMRKFASLSPSARMLKLPLDTHTAKLKAAVLHVTLHCVLLREGQATDEDMQSLASLLSVNNNSDIAVLEDLDEDDYTLSDNSTRQMLDLRQQMEEMTQSLTNSDIAATPNSVQSLKFDSRTPTAPVSPATPTPTQGEGERKERREEEKELPKFTSTPKIDDGLKGIVFKPKTIAKRNLKPLELKTNLSSINLDTNDNDADDHTPTNDNAAHALARADRDKTPVQDLLEWCQAVTGEYRACRVTNLTTSFRSGLAFCAIIHRFRPDLIDFSGLQADDAETNLRVALEASSSLGLPRVLCAADVLARPAPDRLAIMTYLFQLRAHFTGSELQVEQLGNDESESVYLVGRHDTDGSLPRDLFSREVSARRSRNTMQRSQDSDRIQDRASPEKPTSPGVKEMRDMLLQSKTILGKMLSPARDAKPTAKWFAEPLKVTEPPPTRPERLMTRKELTDPFGSDDDDDPPPQANNTITNNTINTNIINTNANNVNKANNASDAASDSAKTEDKPPTIEPAFSDPLTTPDQTIDNVQDSKPDPLVSDLRPLDLRPLDLRPLTIQTDKKVASPELPKPTPQLLSRHDELKERARQLLEATRKEAREKDRMRRQSSKEKEDVAETVKENGLRNGELSPVKKPLTEEERQAVLRERARKLIADARAGIVSPTSPLSPSRARGPTLEIISKQSLMDEIAAAGGVEQLDLLLSRGDSSPNSPNSPASRKSSASPDRSEEVVSSGRGSVRSGTPEERRSPLQSFSALVERLTPDKDHDESRETGSYIQSELEALEREQKAIDERAAALEKQLRRVMESADNTEEEDRLMSQWFNLVNKKNALLRRQMQLNILEQEEDLSRRCELLARELRLSLGVDEWRKTPGQKRRERLLLQELLSAVNERDRLVQEMDEQEKAIADDDAIERNLSQVEIQRKNNCILQ